MSTQEAIQRLRREGAQAAQLADRLHRLMAYGVSKEEVNILRQQQEELMREALVCATLIVHLMTPGRVAH